MSTFVGYKELILLGCRNKGAFFGVSDQINQKVNSKLKQLSFTPLSATLQLLY